MTVSLKHIFQSAKDDSLDATLIQPSNWNEEHELTAAAGKVLGRDTSGAGAVQELPISVTPGGDVTIPNNFAVTGTTTLTNALGVASGGTGLATLPANNVLIGNGTSAVAAVAPGTLGNVLTSNGTAWTSVAAPAGSPSLEAIASGTLPDGSTVIVNVDGTVSVVGLSSTVAPTVFTPTVFESNSVLAYRSVYDAASGKVVIAYVLTTANSLTAIVGTVSGTTISFGTAVSIGSISSTPFGLTYDSTQQRIVIASSGSGSSGGGGLIVGQVSGTTITFGARNLFIGGTANGFQGIVCSYDTNANRVAVAWNRSGVTGLTSVTVSGLTTSFAGSNTVTFGSDVPTSLVYDANAQKTVLLHSGNASVCSFSGATISLGGSVSFAGSTSGTDAVYDANAQKIVVAYNNSSNSNAGTAIVGTVSGTTISFGTAVVFDSSVTSSVSITYHTAQQKVMIAYRDDGNSSFGTTIVGTVSGTSISFSPAAIFEQAATAFTASTYDPNSQKVVISYTDQGNSSFGTATLTDVGTTLTSENFIGFSDGAYTNGQTATIHVAGAVDDAQTSLTPGQSYFVQLNGSIGLTAASPSVFAGTAVAANKIIVKG
jgi:hypothetical protein